MPRSAKAKLRALLDAAVDAIILIDGRGRIEDFNPAAKTMFGYRLDEVVGRNVNMLVSEPYDSERDGYLARYREGGEARIIGIGHEVKARRSDGSVFPIEVSVGKIADNTGTARFVGIIRDVTSRREAQAEVAALRDTLAHMGRLGTIAELGTGIAHEINQPLTAISAYARATRPLLTNPTPDLEAARDALAHIAEQAKRGSAILERLRDLVRHKRSQRAIVPLAAMLEELKPLAEIDVHQHGLRLVWRLTTDLPAVEADSVHIQQVLLNLLHNAAEAMAESRTADQIIVTAQRLDADQVMVSVRDHGPGLPDGHADELLEPFVSHKPNGLGVGLDICRSILSIYEGTLALQNVAGGGTSATFTLPIAHHD